MVVFLMCPKVSIFVCCCWQFCSFLPSAFPPLFSQQHPTMHIFVSLAEETRLLEVDASQFVSYDAIAQLVCDPFHLSPEDIFLTHQNKQPTHYSDFVEDFMTIQIHHCVRGGIDFQHREGSKIGSGGVSSQSQAAMERRERLRKLALETIDITKDPYIMRNHLGTYECKLCLTLHPTESNYLAHTQGKKHQSNLGRRAMMDAKNANNTLFMLNAAKANAAPVIKKRALTVGRPAYKVTKARDLRTKQRSLTFELEYPEAPSDAQPRHRFMSAFEQRVDKPIDKNYQYILFACDPYETVGFKIPNQPIDKGTGRFFSSWDAQNKKFLLQLHFLDSTNDEDDDNKKMVH